MGIIGRLLSHEIDKRIEAVLETRAGYNQKVSFYNPPGDASVPCKEDRILILKIDGTTGKYAAVGMLVESQDAKPGEKIFYGRDADGKIVSKISMLDSGKIKIEADEDNDVKVKGKFYFGNDAQNAAKLLIGLIDEIIALETFGSPPQHKVMPTTITKLEAYKEQVKALYKESV